MQPPKGRKDEIAAVTADELRSQLVLKRMIGKGGFAAVFLGTYNGIEVAVKVILAEHVRSDSPQVKLLLREGQYMSRCTHRSIVKCHAVCQLPADFPGIEPLGHRGSTWALVLEYIGGGSLASLLMRQMSQTRKAYTDYEAYCWVLGIAEALSYLHNAPRPVMHRDVKADNVLLTQDETGRPCAKLMDFGLMAALGGKDPMLRRRSISRAQGEGNLGRSSARSVARGSIGSNLAAPSVATFYNDTTHEAGKIFYLADELPVATVAALTGSRQPSFDFAALGAAAGGAAGAAIAAAAATVTAGAGGGGGGGSVTQPSAAAAAAAALGAVSAGGTTSPNTTFGFTAVASRGCSFDSGVAGGGGGGAAATGLASGLASAGAGGGGGGIANGGGVPWGSRPSSRGGTGSGMSAMPPFGTLVPLNEEASYHGNTAGYAAMILHQQQARREQRQQAASARRAATPEQGTRGGGAGGGGGGGGSLYSMIQQGGAGGGGASFEAGRAMHASSLPSSLHGISPPMRSEFSESPYPALATPESGSSPVGSGRWQVEAALGASASGVRLHLVPDGASGLGGSGFTTPRGGGGGGGNGGGGDAAIALAAARLGRQVSEKDGSLVRMSAPVSASKAPEELPPEVLGDDADVVLRDTSVIQPTRGSPSPLHAAAFPGQQQCSSSRPPSASASVTVEVGAIIASAKRPASVSASSQANTMQLVSSATDGGELDGPTKTAGGSGGGGGGLGCSQSSPQHAGLPLAPLSHPAGSPSASFRVSSHDAVPSVDIGGGRAVGIGAAASAAAGSGTGAGCPGAFGRVSAGAVIASGTNVRTVSAPSSGVHVQVQPQPQPQQGGLPSGAGRSVVLTSETGASPAGGGGGQLSRQASQRSVGSNRSGAGGGGPGAGAGGGAADHLSVAVLLQRRYEQDFQWVWRLTGQTGSCMYMAPEVFRNMPYNEKVDVFSFGILLYEVFSRTLLLVSALNLRELRLRGQDTAEGYAEYVAGGYRPPKPLAMPEPLYELICACWAEDPCERPGMADVVDTLKLLQERYGAEPAQGAPACGCVIS